MKKSYTNSLAIKPFSLLFLIALLFTGQAVEAQGASISLGRAENFAVLAGSTITNTGSTIIVGDIGVTPGSSITGFPPGTFSGTAHVADAAAGWAHDDALAAYNELGGLTPIITLGNEMGGLTLTPGTYNIASAQLTGTLTLNGLGQLNPLFVFIINDTLTTATNSSLVLSGGADAANLYFRVGTSATLGINTAFSGTIISNASNTLNSGATVLGRVIALNGAVTLDGNQITLVPEPGAPILLISALGLGLLRRTRRV